MNFFVMRHGVFSGFGQFLPGADLIYFVGIAETMSCLEETFFLSSSCLDLITIPPLIPHSNLIKKKDLLESRIKAFFLSSRV